MTDLLPWHQRHEESEKSFEAFVEYLKLGPNRSLRKLHAEAGTAEGVIAVSRSTLENWCAAHQWVTRATAWDRHELAARIDERIFVRERVRGRVLQRANRLVDKLCDIALGTGLKKGQRADAAQVKALLGALAIAGISELRSLEVNTESTVKVEAARSQQMPLENLTVEQLREIKAVLNRKAPVAVIDVIAEPDEEEGSADTADTAEEDDSGL